MVFALLFAGGAAAASPTGSPTPSRCAVSRARPASVEEYGRLHNIVEGLCIAGGLPKPRLYIVDDPSPNAFATGRDPKHAAIAVTTGLLEKMNRVELEGVLAHELSHIKNYDILVSTLAVTMVGVIAIAADVGVRFLWFGMGRSRNNSQRRRRGRARRRSSPSSASSLLHPLAAHRPGHAGRGQPPAGDARRRVRRGAHPLPAGPDLGPREAARRLHGRRLHLPRHRPPLDRAAAGGARRTRAACPGSTACSTPTRRSRSASPSSESSDPPGAQRPPCWRRRSNGSSPGASAAVLLVGGVALALVGGGDDAAAADHDHHHDHRRRDHHHDAPARRSRRSPGCPATTATASTAPPWW